MFLSSWEPGCSGVSGHSQTCVRLSQTTYAKAFGITYRHFLKQTSPGMQIRKSGEVNMPATVFRSLAARLQFQLAKCGGRSIYEITSRGGSWQCVPDVSSCFELLSGQAPRSPGLVRLGRAKGRRREAGPLALGQGRCHRRNRSSKHQSGLSLLTRHALAGPGLWSGDDSSKSLTSVALPT